MDDGNDCLEIVAEVEVEGWEGREEREVDLRGAIDVCS